MMNIEAVTITRTVNIEKKEEEKKKNSLEVPIIYYTSLVV